MTWQLASCCFDDSPAALDRCLARVQGVDDAGRRVELLEAEDGRDSLVELARRQAEVGHPELLFPAAGAVPVEDARFVELGLKPVMPRVRDVLEAEVEPVDRFRAFFRQLRSDRLGVLDPGMEWQGSSRSARSVLARIDLTGVQVHLRELGLRVEEVRFDIWK